MIPGPHPIPKSSASWAGAASLPGSVTGGVVLDVPVVRLAAVLAVAVAAGLLASVRPDQRAVRTPPIAALEG